MNYWTNMLCVGCLSRASSNHSDGFCEQETLPSSLLVGSSKGFECDLH